MRDAEDSTKPAIVLFHGDLRIADNRALSAAAESGRPVLPVFVFDEEMAGGRSIGGARRWWLHHSLAALDEKIAALGAKLVLRRGRAGQIVDELIDQSGACAVFWNRRYEPHFIEADARMKADLRKRGLQAESFGGHLLHEPSMLKTGAGGFYKVYTPFWKALMSGPEPRDPVDPPAKLIPFRNQIQSDRLSGWALLPNNPDWSEGFDGEWTPGEDGAHHRLQHFLDGAADGYATARDCPGVAGTSGLSPHLAHGEITPFQIFAAARAKPPSPGIEVFRKEIVWREFCYHLRFHRPDLSSANFNEQFDAFPWQSDSALLGAWQRGQTGYPIVDAGMRQLWQTGWMHNRVRMITASFLIKHLMTDWRQGEAWFWDTLVDADPASNPGNWQWVAGSGADAAPYFRIFNPILQGEKFDPDGYYVRRYVPELVNMPDKYLHRPWDAPKEALAKAGVKLGSSYPVPVVKHDEARTRALNAYKSIRGTS